jgi:protein-tyrosine phosphatase
MQGVVIISPESKSMAIYWITGSGPLHLAIMPRPEGGAELDEDIRALQSESVDILVSLLTAEEITNFDLTAEPDVCAAHGIEYRSFPITDHSVPASHTAALEFATVLAKDLKAGKAIVIHCYAGIGRSSLMAACILVLTGKSAFEAFDQIRQARGTHVPDVGEQFAWVESFAMMNGKT